MIPFSRFLSALLGVFLALNCFSSPSVRAADWVTNWLSSATYTGTGPSAYEVAARNYLSGGYASLRWQTKTLHPISFSPPTLRFGCGGVDIFLGSMGLLDFDYMVSRLKNIMYSAGAFAFKYALTEMCSVCRQVLDTLDAASDFLNQIQLDECKAGKALAVTFLSPFSERLNEEASQVVTANQLFGGAVESWHEFVKKVKGDAAPDETRKMTSTEVADVVSECGSFVTDLTDPSKGNYSVLAYIGWLKGIPKEWIDVVRGLVGDVYVDTSTGFLFQYHGHCRDYEDVPKAFMEGKVQKQKYTVSGSTISFFCEDEIYGIRVKEYAKDRIRELIQKMQARTNPSTSTDEFMKIVGPSIYREVRLAYQLGFDDSFFGTDQNLVVECAAYTFANSLLHNILSELRKLNYDALEEFKTTCADLVNPSRCSVCTESGRANFELAMKILISEMEQTYEKIYRNYTDVVLSADSPCQAWKRAQKTLVELDQLMRGTGLFSMNTVKTR